MSLHAAQLYDQRRALQVKYTLVNTQTDKLFLGGVKPQCEKGEFLNFRVWVGETNPEARGDSRSQ